MRLFPKILSLALVACLVLFALPGPSVWAQEEVTADTPWPNMDELQKQVDDAALEYENATKQVTELKGQIDELNTRISEVQRQLPKARELSDNAARQYYRTFSTSNPFLEMIFGATSLADFFATIEYSTRLNQRYIDDINALKTLNTKLEQMRAELEEKKVAVEKEQLRAEEALLDARRAQNIAEDTARKIAEATAAATAAAAAAAEAEQHTPEPALPPSNPEPGLPEAPTEKQAFVNLWTPRIDAYLAGSPLAGYGYAFANAAYDYNVDPRWSPAIAHLESGKGQYCFLPHNAWGWGSVSWPDWETAIYSHVRGLSIGYGYTISVAAAQKYCPPNWEYWYDFVSNQMTRI